jgi:hypothetical protein
VTSRRVLSTPGLEYQIKHTPKGVSVVSTSSTAAIDDVLVMLRLFMYSRSAYVIDRLRRTLAFYVELRTRALNGE